MHLNALKLILRSTFVFLPFLALGCTSSKPKVEAPKIDADSKIVEVSDYQFIVPKSYEQLELKGEMPDTLATVVLRDSTSNAELPRVINVSVTTDELALKNAQSSPRESVVHFNGGMANAAGVQIEKREETKRLRFNGLELSGFFWTGHRQDGQSAHGLTFGGTDDGRTISIGTLEFGESDQNRRAAQMKYLTSFSPKNPN